MELWRKEETVKSLEQILVEIRTYEAATDNLLDNTRLASGSTKSTKRCYKCENLGHLPKDCISGSQAAGGSRKQANTKCGFCGGPRRCRMKNCPAFSSQCGTCKRFGNYAKYCTDMTRSKARNTNLKIERVKNVEEEGMQEARTTHLSHAAISPTDKDNDPGNILLPVHIQIEIPMKIRLQGSPKNNHPVQALIYTLVQILIQHGIKDPLILESQDHTNITVPTRPTAQVPPGVTSEIQVDDRAGPCPHTSPSPGSGGTRGWEGPPRGRRCKIDRGDPDNGMSHEEPIPLPVTHCDPSVNPCNCINECITSVNYIRQVNVCKYIIQPLLLAIN